MKRLLTILVLALSLTSCGGSDGPGSPEEARWDRIEHWRAAESVCEGRDGLTDMKKPERGLPDIREIVDYLNDSGPPPRKAERDNFLTSCEVQDGKAAACGGLASWAYAKIRSLGVVDSDLWMIQVKMADGTPHTFVRYKKYAIEHYAPGYPSPYYWNYYDKQMEHFGYQFEAQFNLFN